MNVGELTERIDKVFGYNIWGRPLPVAITYAAEPEEIVRDVRIAESQKTRFPDFQKFDYQDNFGNLKTYIQEFKLTTETIPYVILAVTGIGMLSEIPAYLLNLPWYLPVIIFGALIVGCVLKYKDLNESQYY